MKTVVITGAAGGLGRILTARLREQGYHVVASDIEDADVFLDVTSADACRELAVTIEPDIWINCAGVLGAGDAATQPDHVIEQVLDVNVLGVMNGTRAALMVMRARGTGHVINVASLAAWVPVPGECVYAATKAAVLSFTLGVVAELRASGFRDVHCSVVCPDGMLTPMISSELDNPAIALSFTGLRLTDPDAVTRRIIALLRRPRLIASVPRYRGLQVRLIGVFPGAGLRLAPVFEWIGRRKQRTVRGT